MDLSLDVGTRATTINVAEQGQLRLTRSVAVGGRQLLRAIQDDCQVSPQEAERLRATEGLGLLDREPQPKRLRAWFDGLIGEIRRSALSFGPAALSRLVLVGQEGNLSGLAARLGAELQAEPIAPTAAGLFPEAEIFSHPEDSLDRSLTTLGTALRAVDRSRWTVSLLPREVLQARRTGRLRRLAAAVGAAGVLALAGLYLATLRVADTRKAVVADLQAQTTAAATRADEAQTVLDERDRLRAQTELLRKVWVRRYAALEILKTIAFYAPKDVVLTNFTWRPEQALEIRGRAPNSAVVADFQSAVAESPLATRVRLSGVDRAPGRRGTDEHLSFNLEVDWWTEADRTVAVSSLRPWRKDQ
jgi:Tfp pilus assembly protein PilN